MLIRYSRHTDSFTITGINVRVMETMVSGLTNWGFDLPANGLISQTALQASELLIAALAERNRVRADFYATHKRKRPEGSAE